MPGVRSNRVVVGDEVRPATIIVEDGTIVDVGEGRVDYDFGDLVVMPGLVDTHVHVNEPGRAEWEGFASATSAAAAGGTTTIVDMPLNSVPPTVSRPALAAKRAAAAGKLSVDVAFWGGLVPGSEPELAPLVEAGVCGFKSFLVDSGVPEFPPMTPDRLEAALSRLATLQVPCLVHAEDPDGLADFSGAPNDYASYLASRPPEAEASAVQLVGRMSAATGARVHVLHLSSAEAAREVADGPESLTAETCPHYLTFSAEEIGTGATSFKCAPPIRSAAHREALWEALGQGVIAMVVSDHSPAPAEMKMIETGDFARAWGGIASLQLRLPATWTAAAERGFDLVDLTRWLAIEPASLAGLGHRKGAIAVGMDADLVVWDPDGVFEVNGADLRHRHPITPFQGMKLRGTVVTTMLGGKVVFGEDATVGAGRMMRRDGSDF